MKKSIRVAIIEDEKVIRESLRLLIDRTPGYECNLVYVSAEDALANLPTDSIDVVIQDINLPGINGIDCMRELRQRMPATQFMMCTVYDDDDKIFAALREGATGYILKRTPPQQILEAITDLHNGGSPMSSEIARRVVQSMQKKESVSADLDLLSHREQEILRLLAKGYLYKEVADELYISLDTVKKHAHHIYEKLHVQNRTEAINKAFRVKPS